MANRYGNQFNSSPVNGRWTLYGKVSIGAAGAPTAAAWPQNQGITSFTRTSAGLYVIKLADTYNAFLGMNVNLLLASGIPASPIWHIVSETVASNNASTGKKITIEFDSAAGGSATDPDSGTVIYYSIELKNSSV